MNARQRTLLFGTVIAVTALSLFTWAWWPKARPVRMVEVERQALEVQRIDQGFARVRELYVISAPVPGTLSRIELEPGDAVSAGDVIARLSPLASTPLDPRASAMADAAVDTARAQVNQAEAAASSARDLRARSERMLEQKLIPERELTAVRAAEREAEARLAATRASLRQAQVNASWNTRAGDHVLELTAPIDGVVLKRWQESAGSVATGTPLLELGDTRQLEVVAEFLSQEAADMEVGAKASIEAWGGPPLAAEVSRIEPLGELRISALGVEERRVRVILQLKEPAAKLGHGFQVDARITVLALPDVLVVPLEALQRRGTDWQVWVVEQERAKAVTVDVGANDGRFREIRSGLSAGQQVVLNAPAVLVTGDRVSGP
ncbi:MAG: efflux RND transporter periplasmic adaptor subunit [Ahniella sp.]|nr:efflux RND transporter periplasmic adaptor subunit [Ahniella sp.]